MPPERNTPAEVPFGVFLSGGIDSGLVADLITTDGYYRFCRREDT